jgi:hypothetical protein
LALGILRFVALPLVFVGLLGSAHVRAETPRLEDPGDLEHYHHEFYSHSYVDPNYREDSDNSANGSLSKSKTSRKLIKPNTKASIAFGGHHKHPRAQAEHGAPLRNREADHH